MFGRFRRSFPDRNLARQYLTWLPIGKRIKIKRGSKHFEWVERTKNGLVFTPIPNEKEVEE